jgi:hypothetical protein
MAYFNIDNFLSKVAENGFQRTTQFRCKIPVINIGGGGRFGRELNAHYPEACKWLEEGLLCEQTSTPSRSFEPATLSIYGLQEKYPVFTTYTDHTCTFLTPLVKRDGKHYNDVTTIFHEWQNAVQRRTLPGDDAGGGGDAGMVLRFPDDYRLIQGMQIDQFSTYNEKRRGGNFGVNVNAQGNVRDVILDVNRVSNWFDGPQIPTSWTNRQNSDDEDSKPSLSYKFFNVYPQTVESTPLIWLGDADIQRVTVSFTYSYWRSSTPADEIDVLVSERIN